jgi:hypothetical protein
LQDLENLESSISGFGRIENRSKPEKPKGTFRSAPRLYTYLDRELRSGLPSYLHEPTIFSQLLTRANEAELKSQPGPAYRVAKHRKSGAPRPTKMGTYMRLRQSLLRRGAMMP